ncbi:nucleotidyltransferase domain-containing protein [Patescibacteria group bacterium]|nr:MAG: nucleotidyltransferase domain-containing protein [Patescibacteria group bacterium]
MKNIDIDIEKIKPAIAEIAKKYNLSLVVLFGSQAQKTVHKHSDIDLAYFSDKPLEIQKESQLICDFMTIFKIDDIDLVSLRSAPSLLLKNIIDSGAVLYEARSSFFNELQIYAIRKYFDEKRLRDLRSDYLIRKIKQYQKDLHYV